MAGYRLTSLAKEDLRNIWRYTANEWSREQADKYYDGLFLVFDAIADGRVTGKPVDRIFSGLKRAVFVKHYVFFRNVEDDIVEITRVLHVRMDVKNQLR
ncbi:type II toxin-antitoxin system RelE/ParE family toxin [Dyadobacter sp. CY323]|uniref:type II toxin-antitoxin system RelE/ParE family toxin n=1 Tax=Dyadobacter sp. CY323 TaxID=2907302 RepID=UPI001F268DC4|nr:type II toxin-antitoxin system RelE/ParE family toxin [Dyadobacter sp. CY323]MCE6989643.1 type II toxin-antitoxin system RelE/ParE family toxin [Dyadobacter sp. CY323]